MKKYEFLSALRNRLIGLPQEDLERTLEYYGESIDDRMEDGLTEEEAVEAMGSIDEIVSQILMGAPPPKPVKEKAKKRRTWGAGVIALLILGFPLWFPLLAAFAAIVFTLYVLFWSMIAVFYAVDVSFAAGAVAGVFGSVAGLILPLKNAFSASTLLNSSSTKGLGSILFACTIHSSQLT